MRRLEARARDLPFETLGNRQAPQGERKWTAYHHDNHIAQIPRASAAEATNPRSTS